MNSKEDEVSEGNCDDAANQLVEQQQLNVQKKMEELMEATKVSFFPFSCFSYLFFSILPDLVNLLLAVSICNYF